MKTAKKWPLLFKQTSLGKIQQWGIHVEGNLITTVYGLTDGKKQSTTDILKHGLNIGKSNETTPEQQAELQAEQEYQGKLKRGYVLELAQAAEKKNNLAAVEPMLAFPIEKKEKYAVFPALAQPKLDGQRMIAIIEDGSVRLFSRTQKPISGHEHIVNELEKLYAGKTITLDGELYSHALADNFNELMHLAKHGDNTELKYNVYDVVATEGGYKERTAPLVYGEHVVAVETVTVASREELDAYQLHCVEQGYEGCMFRDPNGLYECKRSVHLLKVKSFIDDEFTITGSEEGSGKLMGAVGAFILTTKNGAEFRAKPACSLAMSQWYWVHRAEFVGRLGTVKFQSLTPAGIPRFPVLKAVRED